MKEIADPNVSRVQVSYLVWQVSEAAGIIGGSSSMRVAWECTIPLLDPAF